MDISNKRLTEFRKLIYSHYEKEGRQFPWRINTNDPSNAWGILVSELMLQQTQTSRVVVYWERWMEKWPTADLLNKAPLEEVLKEWSGLGYNRRARYLKECASIIARDLGGKVPENPKDLEKLPGIGPYTAGAIACFAYNFPSVFIETNIRSVIIHFFFLNMEAVTDREIMPVIDTVMDRSNPRKWYWSLMDYGAALKKSGSNPNRRSAHYNKQSAFNGSLRQIRGSIVRSLVTVGPATAESLGNEIRKNLGNSVKEEDLYRAIKALIKESLVAEEDGKYKIKK